MILDFKVVGACPSIFYGKICQNQSFVTHTDTGSVFDKKNNLYSKFTMLIYLNYDFLGGETVFYDNNLLETCRITPKKNKTLIFDIDLFHSGSIVTSGTKYWIGTELLIQR
jgi:hypothetical protein